MFANDYCCIEQSHSFFNNNSVVKFTVDSYKVSKHVNVQTSTYAMKLRHTQLRTLDRTTIKVNKKVHFKILPYRLFAMSQHRYCYNTLDLF